MLNIAVVGVGYWGPNLVRNFSKIQGAQVTTVCDLSLDKLQNIQKNYPSIQIEQDFSKVLQDPNVHAVVLATPVNTHYSLAKAALEAHKHVLLEKPMTTNAHEAQELVDLAQQVNKTLLIDHTFIYMGAIRKLKSLIDSGELGEINYYDAMRVNLGLFQNDVNVAWDLAVHDISILFYLLKDRPIAVSATGMSHLVGQPENVVYITFYYANTMIAHVNVNWLSPVKIRQTLISGTKKMIVFDDLHASEKIKIYDSGVDVKTEQEKYDALVEYRTGEIVIPTYDRTEALLAEAQHFVACMHGEEQPITSPQFGLEIIKTLEAIEKSLAQKGQYTEI